MVTCVHHVKFPGLRAPS